MIRHIVLFTLKADDPQVKDEDAQGIRERLEALTAIIPQVLTLEVGKSLGLVAGHWDLALFTEFASNEDLETYQAHPEHRAVLEYIAPRVSQKAVVDYVSAVRD
ncbi:MAG: Dabb family protein [Microbacteriaceae bacterium]